MTPVNIPDLIQKCCGYGQLWPLRPACSQNHAGSDFPHPTRVCSFKGGLDHIVQNQPGSNLDGLVRFQPNGSCPEASQCAIIIRPGSGRMQPVYYQFPTFRLSCGLLHGTYGLDHTVQNQPGSDLVLADCVKFWSNGSGPEANWCARIIRLTSDQHFRDPDGMSTGFGVFTGTVPLTVR